MRNEAPLPTSLLASPRIPSILYRLVSAAAMVLEDSQSVLEATSVNEHAHNKRELSLSLKNRIIAVK